ncbi:caspase family protein [Streptomyces sp. NPDC002324]
MTGDRFALLIATGSYDSESLQQLRSPIKDVEGLAAVLQDRRIGDFEVTTVIDRQQHQVTRAIERFFNDRRRDDLLLIHISGHGIKSDRGELYFAARNTDQKLLASTAISSTFLQAQMQRCRAKSIVLLLDCCYSGAFLPGAKGDSAVHVRDELAGHGRAVITATNRTEYAWEGNHLSELEPEPSRFTGALIEGLLSGEADKDADGLVSVQDLYEYVYEQLQKSGAKQRPQLYSEIEYRVVVAHSVRGAELELEAFKSKKLIPEATEEKSTKLTGEASGVAPSRTADQLVENLKRYLPNPIHRIELNDLITGTTNRVIEAANPQQKPLVGPVFEESIRGYRADCDTLLHLLAAGVYYDDGTYDALWRRTIERLSRVRDTIPGSYNDALEKLRHYPALLSVWAMGLAAVLANREEFLPHIFVQVSWNQPFGKIQRQSPASYLNPLRIIETELLHDICHPNSGGKYIFVQSHWLRDELREPFRQLEPSDSAYALACHRFELIVSMIAMDSENEFLANPWPGEFLLDSAWGYEGKGVAVDISREISPSWPLIVGGAFDRDIKRAEKCLEALTEYRGRVQRW